MTVSSRTRDAACAAVVFASSLLLYVATLQPDFGGPEDTPKFQFVGYVLGIPHPPGYPLYVLMSHAFGLLPFGTVAYRANLFSAVMAALTCALGYTLARQLGSTRWSAFCVALAMASGASYWRSAVFAEVYSLAAFMTAAIVVLLLDWGHKGRTRRLVAAFGAFAFALGNHLTVIGVVPAFATYVLTRGRPVWSARMLLASGLVLALGLGQYMLIVVRTRQDAPYLETRADRVSDLAAVVTAERYAGQRFAFGPRELLTDHLPALARLIARELGLAGTVLFALGVATGARRADPRFVFGAAAGMFVMILNISGDLKGFITPLVVLLWPAAALGIDGLANVAGRVVAPSAAAALAATIAAIVPTANVVTNYRDADQSAHTEDAAFLRAVFARIPDGAGFVPDDYWSDMAWHYYTFTGESGRHVRISRVPFSAGAVRDEMRRNRPTFALARGATFLAAEGLHFIRADLEGIPLQSWLGALPHGSFVIGATAYEQSPVDLSIVSHPQLRPVGRPRAYEAFAAVVARDGAAWRSTDEGSAMIRADRDTLGAAVPAFPGMLTASAANGSARLDLAGRTIAFVNDGIALAAFSASGALLRVAEIPSGGRRQVPFAGSLYQLAGESPCAELTSERWTDVGPVLRSGGWVTTSQSVGELAIEMRAPGLGDVRRRSTSLLGAGTIQTSVDGETLVTTLARTGEDRPVFRLALDRAVADARARVRPGGSQSSIRICAFEPVRSAIDGDHPARILPDFESEPYFGAGWSDAERSPSGPVRKGEDGATLLLAFAVARGYRVSLDLAAAEPVTLDVLFNGVPLGTCHPSSPGECDVTLPASSILPGLNRLTLSAGKTPGATVRFSFRGARFARLD